MSNAHGSDRSKVWMEKGYQTEFSDLFASMIIALDGSALADGVPGIMEDLKSVTEEDFWEFVGGPALEELTGLAQSYRKR